MPAAKPKTRKICTRSRKAPQGKLNPYARATKTMRGIPHKGTKEYREWKALAKKYGAT